MFCCHICHNIAIQIRQNHNFNALIEIRIQHFCTHSIHQTFLHFDLRVFLSDFSDCLNKITVYQLHNICLCNNRYIFLSIFSGKFKGCPGNPLASLFCLNFEIHRQIIAHLNALVTPDIFSLDIFPEKGPVNIFIRDFDRSDCRKKFQFSSQKAVCADQIWQTVTGSRCHHRSFHQYITGFDLRDHIGRQAFHFCHTILYGHSFNGTDLDFVCSDLISYQFHQHPQRLFHQNRADTVSRENADHNGIFFGDIFCLLCFFHFFNPS